MSHTVVLRAFVVLSLVSGSSPVVFAAEQQAGQGTAGHKPVSSSSIAHQPSSASNGAASIAEPHMTVQGVVTSLNTTSATPMLSVTLANGTSKTFAVDSDRTMVWKAGQAIKLNQWLRETSMLGSSGTGSAVKIRYVPASGTETAEAIWILPAQSTTATPAMPSAPAGSVQQ